METKTETNLQTAEFTTQCLCMECPNCSSEQGAWIGEEITCPMCGAEFEASPFCFEDVDEGKSFIREHTFDPWRQVRADYGDHENLAFYIRASGMTWRSISAMSAQLTTFDEAWECLQIDSDYRLKFIYNPTEKTLNVVRYSHDEPTGAAFEFLTWDIDAIEERTRGELRPILDLWRWSSNFGAGSAANPLSMFMDLIGFSQDYYGGNFHPWDNLDGCGYVEADYLADALKVWSTMPQDVTELLENLCNYANN